MPNGAATGTMHGPTASLGGMFEAYSLETSGVGVAQMRGAGSGIVVPTALRARLLGRAADVAATGDAAAVAANAGASRVYNSALGVATT